MGHIWAAHLSTGQPTWAQVGARGHIEVGPTWLAHLGPRKLPIFNPLGSHVAVLTGEGIFENLFDLGLHFVVYWIKFGSIFEYVPPIRFLSILDIL